MNIYNKLLDIFSVIPEEDWKTHGLGGSSGPRCAIGHMPDKLFNEFNRNPQNSYILITVNDGEHAHYQQPTAKQRVMQYCKDNSEQHDITHN